MVTIRNQRQEAADLVEAVNRNKDIETLSWKEKVTNVPLGVKDWFDENGAAYHRKIQHVRRH